MKMSYRHNTLFTGVFVTGLLMLVFSGCEKVSEKSLPPSLPIVTTLVTTGISTSSAVSGGKVLSTGNLVLSARGVCWNTTGNPTIDDRKTYDGNGMGTYASLITGLEIGTTYYVKAYAVNSVGIAYGGAEFFTTTTFPTVITSDITTITGISAISGGNVTFCGGASVTSKGVCWSMSENPTIKNSKTTDGKNIGVFKSLLTGLALNTTYYLRAYATNSVGTAYGIQKSFTTAGMKSE